MRFAVSKLVWALGAAFHWPRDRVLYTCCLWPSHKIPAVFPFSLTLQGHENMRFKSVEANLLPFPLSLVIYPEHPRCACHTDPLTQFFVFHLEAFAVLCLCLLKRLFWHWCPKHVNEECWKTTCTYPQNCHWRRGSRSLLAQRPGNSGDTSPFIFVPHNSKTNREDQQFWNQKWVQGKLLPPSQLATSL